MWTEVKRSHPISALRGRRGFYLLKDGKSDLEGDMSLVSQYKSLFQYCEEDGGHSKAR